MPDTSRLRSVRGERPAPLGSAAAVDDGRHPAGRRLVLGGLLGRPDRLPPVPGEVERARQLGRRRIAEHGDHAERVSGRHRYNDLR